MTRRHLVILGCAALVMLTPVMTVSLSAQGKWWTSDKYKQRLGLTAEQSKQCEQIFQAMAPRLRAAKQALEREEARFSELLKRSDSPESKITEAIDTLEAARSEAGKILYVDAVQDVYRPHARAAGRDGSRSPAHPHWVQCATGEGLRPTRISIRLPS